MLQFLVLAVLGAVAKEPVMSRCDRGAPQPVGFHARGFGYVAEVFPPKSRQNSGSRPLAYFYEVGYPGTEWRVAARRLWAAELANAQMPQAALVSMAGDFVTLDDYYQADGEHALVIYARDGRARGSRPDPRHCEIAAGGCMIRGCHFIYKRLWSENARRPAIPVKIRLPVEGHLT